MKIGYAQTVITPTEAFKYKWNPFKPGRNDEETTFNRQEITPKVMVASKSVIASERQRAKQSPTQEQVVSRIRVLQ